VPPLHPTHNPTPPRDDTRDTLLRAGRKTRYETSEEIILVRPRSEPCCLLFLCACRDERPNVAHDVASLRSRDDRVYGGAIGVFGFVSVH